MSLSALETIDCPLPEKFMPGEAPRLDWLDTASLRIDSTYQRPVVKQGRSNIAQIVANFRWNRFSALVVREIDGGRYTVIDGQHRAVAAQRLGIEKVPCQVVKIAPGEEGGIFAAINSLVTPMSAQNVFKAARASKEKWAMAIDRVCARARVEPLTYPVQTNKQKPRQTMILGTLRKNIERFGELTVGIALEGMMKSRNAEVPGFCRSGNFANALALVRSTPNALQEPEAVIAALSKISFSIIPGAAGTNKTFDPSPLRIVKRDETEKILEMADRRLSISYISTTLKLPYAEVRDVVEGRAR